MLLSDLTEQNIKAELKTITEQLKALEAEQHEAELRVVMAWPDPALLKPLEGQLAALDGRRRVLDLMRRALEAEQPEARTRDLLAEYEATRDRLAHAHHAREHDELQRRLNSLTGQLHQNGIDTGQLPEEVKGRLLAEYEAAREQDAALARWGKDAEGPRRRLAARMDALAARLSALGVDVAALSVESR